MDQFKKDREEYLSDIKTCWSSEDMYDYFRKEFDGMVKFSDGNYITLEKPSIKKDFCYGYGMYGITTEDEEERANAMRRKAEQDANYFIESNLSPLMELKASVIDESYTMYIYTHYIGESDGCHLKGFAFCRQWEEPHRTVSGVRNLTRDEREKVAKAIDEQIERFKKRLNTYLKRYGLSKVNSWTYLVD